MTVVFWILGGLFVFAIAAAAIGTVTAGLARSHERVVFDAEQSLEFVAEALPSELTAELSYDDVRRILRLLHDHLHARGVATTAGEDGDEVAVVSPEEAVAEIVARAADVGIAIEPDHARAVVDAQMAYFEAIGALGGPADVRPDSTPDAPA